MFVIDVKLCPHCVGRLTTFQLDEPAGQALRAPVYICESCDGRPVEDEPLYPPRNWV